MIKSEMVGGMSPAERWAKNLLQNDGGAKVVLFRQQIRER
jgi:hypothetical protein